MKMQRTSRSDRLEHLLRWMMGVALAVAVGWAWMENVQTTGAGGTHAGAIVQRS